MSQHPAVLHSPGAWLRRLLGYSPFIGSQAQVSMCAVLQAKTDFKRSIRVLRQRSLPIHSDKPKNWDSLAAFLIINKFFPEKDTQILDAGGEYYSSILPQLASCGYTNLRSINLAFREESKRGNIIYEYGDITKTRFPDRSFGAITCLSVIEHGVNIGEYFREMSRILRPGGILFTSTDYWFEQIDTGDKIAYGSPIRIFNPHGIAKCLHIAKNTGLELMEPVPLTCRKKVVRVKPHDLGYTFIYFTHRKPAVPG